MVQSERHKTVNAVTNIALNATGEALAPPLFCVTEMMSPSRSPMRAGHALDLDLRPGWQAGGLHGAASGGSR